MRSWNLAIGGESARELVIVGARGNRGRHEPIEYVGDKRGAARGGGTQGDGSREISITLSPIAHDLPEETLVIEARLVSVDHRCSVKGLI